MTPKQSLQQLVHNKIERQATLRGISRNLETLDSELSSAKFGRFFGTSYWFVKRWLTLLVGVVLVVIGFGLMVAPEVLYESNPEAFEANAEMYEHLHQEQLQQGLELLAQGVADSKELTLESVSKSLKQTYDAFIVQQIQEDIAAIGLFLMIVALVLLYISRQAGKVRERNSAISQTETLAQDLARSFQQVIDGEEEELQDLKALLTRLG